MSEFLNHILLDMVMEKVELEELIASGCSTRDIAKLKGKSQTAVRHWLKKFGLTTVKHNYLCRCGETEPSKFMKTGEGKRSKTRCRKCHSQYTVDRFRDYKLKAVEYKGGECESCGYDKCPGSLHFHHRDPSQKDPKWRQMKNWSFDRVKMELDKCSLLCANCHGEMHWDLGD